MFGSVVFEASPFFCSTKQPLSRRLNLKTEEQMQQRIADLEKLLREHVVQLSTQSAQEMQEREGTS